MPTEKTENVIDISKYLSNFDVNDDDLQFSDKAIKDRAAKVWLFVFDWQASGLDDQERILEGALAIVRQHLLRRRTKKES